MQGRTLSRKHLAKETAHFKGTYKKRGGQKRREERRSPKSPLRTPPVTSLPSTRPHLLKVAPSMSMPYGGDHTLATFQIQTITDTILIFSLIFLGLSAEFQSKIMPSLFKVNLHLYYPMCFFTTPSHFHECWKRYPFFFSMNLHSYHFENGL
jgi:hypothetical protein